MKHKKSICVYCGSSPGNLAVYENTAFALGKAMALADIRLVYGGGTRGLMGAVARGVSQNGGTVMGIIPRFLMQKEATESDLEQLDELVITEDMHERKHRMFEESDAFVTLPGGIGTLEEVIEILTWAQLGQHSKPIVLADIENFWAPLHSLIDHMKLSGFIHTAHKVQPLVMSDIDAIVPTIRAQWTKARDDADMTIIEKL